ncbi:MAG: hypothetical protein PWQ06_2024 [Anaerophaga sp.]|nr:hypothetical protein [Anaerophaga sp.]
MKSIYMAVAGRLKAEVPVLRWIDLDTDQLDTTERPPIALPAALVSVEYGSCKTITDRLQICDATVSVTLVFNNPGPTAANTPEPVSQNSLQVFDTIAQVHEALQGFESDGFEALSRVRQAKERSRHGWFRYRLQYSTLVEE